MRDIFKTCSKDSTLYGRNLPIVNQTLKKSNTTLHKCIHQEETGYVTFVIENTQETINCSKILTNYTGKFQTLIPRIRKTVFMYFYEIFNTFSKRWNMYFDYQDNLMVCTIDKVGSTTIYFHFKHLAFTRIPGFLLSETSRDETRDIVYSLKRGTFTIFFFHFFFQ